MKTEKRHQIGVFLGEVLPLLFFVSCGDKGSEPADNIPAQNLPPSMPAIISPADRATNVAMDFVLEWESSDPENDEMNYSLYFGLDSIPTHSGNNYTRNYYRSPWACQNKARVALLQIFNLQNAYHAIYGAYCLNGMTTYSGDSSFTVLGFYPDADDIYNYMNVEAGNTFTCAAIANLDFDASIDTWNINQTGIIECTVNDLAVDPGDFPYQTNTKYYWQVSVSDGNNDIVTGPVWSFTTGQDTFETNLSPGIPILSSPMDASNCQLDELVFFWDCSDPDGDPLRYDLYLDSQPLQDIPPYNHYSQTHLTTRFRPSIWTARAIVRGTLMRIYEVQTDYHNLNGNYAFNDVTANYENNNFAPLGVALDSLNIYTYCMMASANTFTCTATGNLDCDATNDVWAINESGELTCTTDDFILIISNPANTTFYWRIAAHDNHGHTTFSQIWTFTADSVMLSY